MKNGTLFATLLVLFFSVAGCSSENCEPCETSEEEETPIVEIRDLLGRNSLTDDLIYIGQEVTIKDCIVIGTHGTTLTIQQPSYSWWGPTAYSIEVVSNEIPDGLDLLMSVDVTGIVDETSVYRVILTDAIVTINSTDVHSYELIDNSDESYLWDPTSYYYYSGLVMDAYLEFAYEMESPDVLKTWYDIDEDIYRAFAVYVYADENCMEMLFGTYIVLYDDVNQDVKSFYDAFFDGTNSEISVGDATIEAGWDGISEGDLFHCHSKIQFCSYEFLFNFDEFETRTISSYSVPETFVTILYGVFDNQVVTLTGIVMERHGNVLSIQNPVRMEEFCILVECSTVPEDLKLYSLVNVTGTVKVTYKEDDWLWHSYSDAVRTLENASIEVISDSDQEYGYFNSFLFDYAYEEPIFNGAFFDLTIKINSLPESWETTSEDDFEFSASVYYQDWWGDSLHIDVPVIVFGDSNQDVKNFWHAYLYGTDSDVSLSYPYPDIAPDVTIKAGTATKATEFTFSSWYVQYLYDYESSSENEYSSDGAFVLGFTSAMFLQLED